MYREVRQFSNAMPLSPEVAARIRRGLGSLPSSVRNRIIVFCLDLAQELAGLLGGLLLRL